MKRNVFLDSFSGAVSDLKPGMRTSGNVLRVLATDPRVSTWDMSELSWLRGCIRDLTWHKLIAEDKTEAYPWHRYPLTEAGRAALSTAKEMTL